MEHQRSLRVALTFFLVAAFFSKRLPDSANDASRMDQIESLVERGTLSIDDATFPTIDKYRYQNRFYSDKPPTLALCAAPLYRLLKAAGISFRSHPKIAYTLITLAVIGGLSSVALAVFRWLIKDGLPISDEWADVVTCIAGTGTLILPYATVFNNHVVSGALILIGFGPLLRRNPGGLRSAAFSGLLISLAGAIDFGCFLFYPLAAVLFVRRSRWAGGVFTLASVPCLALYLALNVLTSGSIIPPAMNAPLWEYPGSEFSRESLSGLATHKGILPLSLYAFHMLLGNRGLLLHTPILLFSIVGCVKIGREIPGPSRKAEFRWLFAAALVFLGFFIFRSTNCSGWAFGVRWYATVVLILLLPVAGLESAVRSSRSTRWLFLATAAGSILISVLGTVSPWTPDPLEPGDPGYPSNSILGVLRVLMKASMGAKAKLLIGLGAVYVLFFCTLERWRRTWRVQPPDPIGPAGSPAAAPGP